MLNLVVLEGNIGKVRPIEGSSDNAPISFSLATWKSFKKQDGTWERRTVWHEVALFVSKESKPKMYETISRAKIVSITGELSYRVVEKDGSQIKYTNIVTQGVRILSYKEGEAPVADAVLADRKPTRQVASKVNEPPARSGALPRKKPAPVKEQVVEEQDDNYVLESSDEDGELPF